MIYRSVPRLIDPQPVNYSGMFWLSLVAIALNGYAAWILSKGTSKNESMLNLHMLEDVLGWIGVLIVSILMNFTEAYRLDPILSILIALYILYKTVPEFFTTMKILLNGSPENVNVMPILWLIHVNQNDVVTDDVVPINSVKNSLAIRAIITIEEQHFFRVLS